MTSLLARADGVTRLQRPALAVSDAVSLNTKSVMNGKNAVVTGSTSGIGLGIAHHLAERGCNIIITGLAEEAVIQEILTDFKSKYKGTTHFVPCDLTKEDEIRHFCTKVKELFSNRIDVLINNAGIQFPSLIEEFPLETWNTMMAIGLTAPFLLIQKFLPAMKENRWGRIINISSIMGIISSAGRTPYSVCKSGLIGLTKGVALETASYGITSNAICPGFTDAPIFYNKVETYAAEHSLTFEEAMAEVFKQLNPHKKPITVKEIAELVGFLCTSGADSVTGSSLVVDAGYTVS